jgi:hypothetical protein
MALKRVSPNRTAARNLLIDILTGAIAAGLLVMFAMLTPTT